jgi:hypothetical protein
MRYLNRQNRMKWIGRPDYLGFCTGLKIFGADRASNLECLGKGPDFKRGLRVIRLEANQVLSGLLLKPTVR